MEKYGLDSTRAIIKSNQKPLYKVQLIIIPQTPLFCKEFNYRINDGQTTLSITKVFLNCDKTITDTFNLFVFFDSKMSSIINKMDKFCTNIISLHKLVMICTAVNKCNTDIRLILYSVGYFTTCASESTFFFLKSTNNKKYPTI